MRLSRSSSACARLWINAPQLIYPHVCWGGFGASGIGRELGVAGLRSYQELRHAMRAID